MKITFWQRKLNRINNNLKSINPNNIEGKLDLYVSQWEARENIKSDMRNKK